MNTQFKFNTLRLNGNTVRGIIAMSMLLVPLRNAAADPSTTTNESIIADMGLGDGESWVVTPNGKVKGWGKRYCDTEGCLVPADIPEVELGSAALEVHSNGEFTAVLLANNTIVGWDDSTLGTPLPEPIPLDGNASAVELAMGLDFLCARLTTDGVRCQGLGDAADGSPLSPMAGFELDAVTKELTAGTHHACALLESGDVQCWGSNASGQLMQSTTGLTNIALDGPALRVAAGGEHSCALLGTGDVQCWGSNTEGQLGHSSPGIATVPLGSPAVEIAVGAEHSCAVTQQPEAYLYCWGNDDLGQLGEGEILSSLRRVDLGGHHATAVFAGATAWTTFVMLDHGGLRGWGNNDAGQLGYGQSFVQPDPEQVVQSVGHMPDILIYHVPDED